MLKLWCFKIRGSCSLLSAFLVASGIVIFTAEGFIEKRTEDGC